LIFRLVNGLRVALNRGKVKARAFGVQISADRSAGQISAQQAL